MEFPFKSLTSSPFTETDVIVFFDAISTSNSPTSLNFFTTNAGYKISLVTGSNCTTPESLLIFSINCSVTKLFNIFKTFKVTTE
jgi:hypothetical protein